MDDPDRGDRLGALTVELSETRQARDDALDALEGMVSQYLPGSPEEGYDHIFMSAGEEACRVLARLRPQQWEASSTGIGPREKTDGE